MCPKLSKRRMLKQLVRRSSSIGVVAGLLGAVCFGFIPVFGKPALEQGLSPMCILAYRFTIATIVMGLFFRFNRARSKGSWLRLPLSDVPGIALISVFYCISGGCLMAGYEYMSGGVTGVLHFSYPVFVVLIMFLFFRERVKMSSIIAILIAIAGIYCLGVLGGEVSFLPGVNRVEGVLIVLLSGVGYAAYLVSVGNDRVKRFDSLVITFWILVFTSVIFIALAIVDGSLKFVTDPVTLLNFLGLAIISTVVANVLVVFAVRTVGSTLESILSAMEPVTSVVACSIIFGEQLTLPIIIGILLIFAAVGIVVYGRRTV